MSGNPNSATPLAETPLTLTAHPCAALRFLLDELTRHPDVSYILNLIIQHAVELIPAAASGTLYLWDNPTQSLLSRAWYQGDWQPDTRIRLGEGLVGTVAQRGVGLLINDYRSSPYARACFIDQFGLTAAVAEPLLYRHDLLGVIALNNARTRQYFTSQDHDVLRQIATQATIAIHHAKLDEMQAAWIGQLQVLTHLNHVVSSSLEMEVILDKIVRAAVRLMQAPQVALWTADESARTLKTCAFAGDTPELNACNANLQLSYDDGGIGWVATHRQPLNVPDIEADDRFIDLERRDHGGLRSFFAIPIVHDTSLLAVLAFKGRQPFRFKPSEQQLLNNLESQAASVMTNARLFHHIKHQTDMLQASNTELSNEIAERQRAEQALRQAKAGLEQRVVERTATLKATNVQLELEIDERRQAEKRLQRFAAQLERSNRELQDFAYVASHDLQEPLRKIQTFGDRLEQLLGDQLDPQGHDYFERLQHASKRMQILIADLLTLAQVTTKAQPFIPVDLTEIVHEVVADLDIYIEQLVGRVDIAPLPTIHADPLQMRQLFQNLIGNALKFHQPDQPPIVCIQAYPDRQQTACRIGISDNGIGFDTQYRDRIFAMFQRLHGRHTHEGTGIGLAICRKIVERHNGHITADSLLGQGTTFVVTLPSTQVEETP